jgi:hypothetical protein
MAVSRDAVLRLQRLCGLAGLHMTEPVPEDESADYDACWFRLGTQMIRFRTAKVTPKKVGQFVTLWKRSPEGPIAPFDDSDPVDYFVVATLTSEGFGQFVFPKAALARWGVLSRSGVGGKRGFRVYPSWDRPVVRQAITTQAWQLPFFVETTGEAPVDLGRMALLLGNS